MLKVLGIDPDLQFPWENHISVMANRMSGYVYLLRWLKRFLPFLAVVSEYFGLFISTCIYTNSCWDHSGQAPGIFGLQRRVVRVLTIIGYKDDVSGYWIFWPSTTTLFLSKNAFFQQAHFKWGMTVILSCLDCKLRMFLVQHVLYSVEKLLQLKLFTFTSNFLLQTSFLDRTSDFDDFLYFLPCIFVNVDVISFL